MERKDGNIIESTETEWQRRKKLLGFGQIEAIPEDLQNEIGKFLIELTSMQVLLEVFENLQADGSVLDKLQHGLFQHQYSLFSIEGFKLAIEVKDVQKQKFIIMQVIIKIFSDYSRKIKDILYLLEQHQATNEYKILSRLSEMLEKFVFDLKEYDLKKAEEVISKFRNNLSELIKIEN